MEDAETSWQIKVLVFVLFILLLLPVILVLPLSFSSDEFLAFPPSGYSWRWYEALLANRVMLHAFQISLVLGVVVTAITIAVTIPAAYVIVRLRPPGTEILYNLFTAPLLLPTIVLGLAILIVFASAGLLGTYHGVALGHLVITLPYALRVLATALDGLPHGVEEAAATLGAPPLAVFGRVTLPLMGPGIVAATALSFLVSFDEVVITLFLAGPQVTTLPVELFRHVETRSDPLVAAASVLLIVLTLVVVMIVDRSVGVSKTFVR